MMYWTPPGLGSTASASFSSSDRRTGATCSPFRNLGREGRGVFMMLCMEGLEGQPFRHGGLGMARVRRAGVYQEGGFFKA